MRTKLILGLVITVVNMVVIPFQSEIEEAMTI